MERKIAYGRVGLLGNPSDIYGGKCISFTIPNCAWVEAGEAERLQITGRGGIEKTLDYNGKHDLIKATLKQLGLGAKPLNITYGSNIPYWHGLSGSSAIVIAAMRLFDQMYSLGLDNNEMAEKALKVETQELGIAAGFQDRYIIAHQGLCFMDFSGKEHMRDPKEDGYGKVEHLEIPYLPFFLALSGNPKSSSGVHSPLRKQFLAGGKEAEAIKAHMDRIANLAVYGKECLEKEDLEGLGRLMNRNTELREYMIPHLSEDAEMIRTANKLGALGAKVAGSGGAIIVLADQKRVLEEMLKKYLCMTPGIACI